MKQHLEGLSLFLPSPLGIAFGKCLSHKRVLSFSPACCFPIFLLNTSGRGILLFFKPFPRRYFTIYSCTHHESIFHIHNFCSECMHSELANLGGESTTFLTISYFSVEKNSNSAVGHSNQHQPFDHSSNKLLLVFQLYSQRNQFSQF